MNCTFDGFSALQVVTSGNMSPFFTSFCSAGCYFHTAEDPAGWHRTGLYMSDIWTFLPRGHDPCKCPPWKFMIIYHLSISAQCDIDYKRIPLSLRCFHLFLCRAKWCFSSLKNHQLVCWSMLFAATFASQIISGTTVLQRYSILYVVTWFNFGS